MSLLSHRKVFLSDNGLLIAFAIALAAQYLFTGNIISHTRDSNTWEWLPRYSGGTILLVFAIIWAVLAAKTRLSLAQTSPTAIAGPITYRSCFLGLAALAYGFSLVHYLLQGEDILTHCSWLAGVLFFLGASISLPTFKTIPWREFILVGLLIALGSWLRFWRSADIPTQIENDVALMGTLARRLIEANDYRWIGFSESEHLRSYDQLYAWSMRLFGNHYVGLVRISALAGVLTIPIVYLLGRVSFGPAVGLVAALILTTSYTHIHFSRIMFGPFSTLLASIALLGLINGIKTRKPWSFSFAGIATGFALLQYDSGKVIPVIGCSLLVWDWITTVKHGRRIMGTGWLFYFIGILMSFGPMLAFILHDFQSFVGRGNVVAIWTPDVWRHAISVHKTDNPLLIMLYQCRATFLSLHLYGDRSPHFALQRPMVSPMTAAFVVIGIGICIRRWRDIRYGFPLLWVMFTFILGGVITYDPPYWPHLNIALPAIALLAGLGIHALWNVTAKFHEHYGKLMMGIVLIGLLCINSVNNWALYMQYNETFADIRIRVARYVTQQAVDYEVIILGDEFFWDDYTFIFFNPGVAGRNISYQELFVHPPVADRPLLFIISNSDEGLDFLRQHYPDGIAEERNQRGKSFIAYHVIPKNE